MSAPDAERDGSDGDVLSNLPRSRPHRRSAKRQGQATSTPAVAKAAAKPAAKARTAKAGAEKPSRPAAAKPARSPSPTVVARDQAAKRLRTAPRPPQPMPPRAGETKPPKREENPSGAELVGTVVQAAGELAQVGLTIGGQVLKRAVARLPKP